ncbi:uncharacterized protein LOC113290428 isoform X2 [Papaver somniferum]|uniref:uncharacterized protein LOC113290428 isoform X2 n=1 Tax=Papaver somniferum TaxID=3469 RepID=UPI000E701511|nr:uncharacterized protein LOC113290428 isoform X2 [Papaver somniferum]
MDELLKLSPSAAEYMMRENPEQWSRAFYDQSTSSEHTNNKFCESFNNMVNPMRDKPICTLGMMYGQLIMGMFYKRRAEADKLELGQLVPSVLNLIKKIENCTHHLRVNEAVYGRFYEVRNIETNTLFQVDIVKKTFTCVQWQLRGIPCIHVVCVLMDMRINYVDYCDKCYLVDALRATYAPEMGLLLCIEEWDEPEDMVVIIPPIDIRKPGRPCKKRKRAYDEGHTEKKVISCTICKSIGHNRRTCAGAPVGYNPKAKRQRTMVQGGSHSTSYPDSVELSTSRRARGGRRGRRGAASSSSVAASSSQPTNNFAPGASSSSTAGGRGSRGCRGARGGSGMQVHQTLSQSIAGVGGH